MGKYSDGGELYNLLRRVSAVGRALPKDKFRIVRVLQSYGEILAVTGDGVNHVPALKHWYRHGGKNQRQQKKRLK